MDHYFFHSNHWMLHFLVAFGQLLQFLQAFLLLRAKNDSQNKYIDISTLHGIKNTWEMKHFWCSSNDWTLCIFSWQVLDSYCNVYGYFYHSMFSAWIRVMVSIDCNVILHMVSGTLLSIPRFEYLFHLVLNSRNHWVQYKKWHIYSTDGLDMDCLIRLIVIMFQCHWILKHS